VDDREWLEQSPAGRLIPAFVELDGVLTMLEAEVRLAEDNDPTAFEMCQDALKTVQTLYDHLNGLTRYLVRKYT
jgi:hypothetical protein